MSRMTIKDLKDFIKDLPDGIEIIKQRYSDYDFVSPSCFEIVEAIDNDGLWLMRSHKTMSEENKLKAKKYLFFAGN